MCYVKHGFFLTKNAVIAQGLCSFVLHGNNIS